MFDVSTASSAADAFEMQGANFTILLDQLLQNKRKHAAWQQTQPENWGFVGDMQAVEELLKQAVERLNPQWSGT